MFNALTRQTKRQTTLSLASHLLWGVLFGVGFALSGMTSPDRVLAFLDITGAWDPSLLLSWAAR